MYNINKKGRDFDLAGMSEEEKKYLINLGQRIRTLREEQSITSAEMARRMHMDRGNYTRIETGKTNPTYLTFMRIANIYSTTVNDLVNFD